MRSLELSFDCGELISTVFQHPLIGNRLVAVRGKTVGAFRSSTGSFQWTTGVQALSVLVVGTKLASLDQGWSPDGFKISGRTGSLAVSLDNAIMKDVNWLQDMFGVDTTGTSQIRRVLLRTNSGMKRKGPVAVAINENFLPMSSVRVCDSRGQELNLQKLRTLYRTIAPTPTVPGATLDTDIIDLGPNENAEEHAAPKSRFDLEGEAQALMYIARYG